MPLDAFYSLRDHSLVQILPDPYQSSVHLLSYDSELPQSVDDVIEDYELRFHTLDRLSLASHEASVTLPSLVVDEPPGAGLREAGIHNWAQNGRLAYATLLGPGPSWRGPSQLYAVVNRWLRPELIFLDLRAKSGDRARPVTATLPSDFHIVGAIAASRGPQNLGLLAVHGGDKIAVFEVEEPREGRVRELARIEITPVVSPIRDDRRMISGPIAWSADGSYLIAAGNEGDAEVLILSVEDCGGRIELRHVVTACPYADYNGLAGIVTANGTSLAPRSVPSACPRPRWLFDPKEVGSDYVLSLPWAGTGR
jgi:hypothetical protein